MKDTDMGARNASLAVLLLTVVAVAPILSGQSLVSGDITGTVADPSDAVLPGAKVTLKNTATDETRTTATNNAGAYRFAFVPPGNYVVSIRAAGFTTAEKAVISDIGRTTISDFKLRVGSGSESVEVQAATALVQSDSSDLSTSFGSELIQSLPNAGNDLTYIAQAAPGVNMNTGGGNGNFQAFGLPALSNLFTVNGENATNPYVNLDASGASNLMLGRNEVEEATVTTIGYSGQFGQQAGVQINYVTKSGTNQFHGNAAYWWTGRALDANGWFNNRTAPKTPRPFANNNQWAGSLGGPIRKDKLFFFVDNEGIAYVVPSATAVFSPSPQFSSATLDNLATVSPASVPLYAKMFRLYEGAPGYNTNTPVPGGGCLDFTPGFSGPCFVQYQANPAEPAQEWMLVGRVDVDFSDMDRMFFRVSLDHGTQATYADPINSAFSASSYQPQYNGQAQWTHVFGPNATNSFVMAGSYGRGILTQKNASATFPIFVNLSAVGYTSMANLESVFPQGANLTQYQFIDDYSLAEGKHQLRFGANWRRYDITDYSVALRIHPQADVTSVAQFYNGQSVDYVQNFPGSQSEPVAFWGMGLYAQDEWRVHKNLQLILAVRLEKNSDPVCQTDCAAYFTGPFRDESTDPNTPYNSMILADRHQILPATDRVNWAPRLGIAWSPGVRGKTVVRAGVGIFYDAYPLLVGDSFMTNVPNVVGIALCCKGYYWADTTSGGTGVLAAASAEAIRNGFATGASFNSSSSGIGGNFSAPSFSNVLGTFHTPQYQKWSLQVQQQLDVNSSVSLSYVGNHGVHIPIYNYPNAFGNGLAGVPSAPYSISFTGVAEIITSGISNYNGVTAAFNRRVSKGFQLQVSYTWSHTLDDVSNGGVLGYSTSSLDFQVNPFCLACNNYGNADYDIRQSFNAAYVWTMRFRLHTRALDQLFAGWTISQNFFARSGLPLTAFDNTTLLPNFGTVPAQVIAANAQMSCQDGNSQCLNPAAFESATAYGAYPTQARNMFRGPAFFGSDLSVDKNIKLTERLAFQFGVNLYNAFNHPNFANPNSDLSAVDSAGVGEPGGNFGMITRTATPPTTPYGSFFAGSPSGRIIQIQSKVIF
jgi:hypothetical protein